ncbi:MAG: hypothetical protein PHU86_02655 [Patescibacteria group bacterium]|nr:hypothetical protein [Patescibacteria group bacterium]
MTKASLDIIKKETEEMLKLLGVSLDVSISADLDGVLVNLSGEDSAIMIGHHGENLSAFAFILGMMLRKKIDRELMFRVDINGYLKDKDKKITEMVERAIEKVRTSGFPEEMTGLNAYERRLAHTVVAKESLLSESKGYGEDRILVIKPRRFDEESS